MKRTAALSAIIALLLGGALIGCKHKRSHLAVMLSRAHQLSEALNLYQMEHGVYPESLDTFKSYLGTPQTDMLFVCELADGTQAKWVYFGSLWNDQTVDRETRREIKYLLASPFLYESKEGDHFRVVADTSSFSSFLPESEFQEHVNSLNTKMNQVRD